MPPTIAPLAKYKLVFLGDQVAHAGKQCNPCTPDFLSHHFALTLPGTQSVGKTSIITRFMYDQFDKAYQVQVPQFMVVSAFQNCCVSPHDMASLRPGLDPPGNNRNRLPLKDNVPRGPHCAPAAVGHSRPGAIPFADPQYIRDSSVAVVVYDITDRASFLNSSKVCFRCVWGWRFRG